MNHDPILALLIRRLLGRPWDSTLWGVLCDRLEELEHPLAESYRRVNLHHLVHFADHRRLPRRARGRIIRKWRSVLEFVFRSDEILPTKPADTSEDQDILPPYEG